MSMGIVTVRRCRKTIARNAKRKSKDCYRNDQPQAPTGAVLVE